MRCIREDLPPGYAGGLVDFDHRVEHQIDVLLLTVAGPKWALNCKMVYEDTGGHPPDRKRWMALPLAKGSHQQYVHPNKKGRVTVAGKPNDDVLPKTLATIFWQAKLEKPH